MNDQIKHRELITLLGSAAWLLAGRPQQPGRSRQEANLNDLRAWEPAVARR